MLSITPSDGLVSRVEIRLRRVRAQGTLWSSAFINR